LPAIRLSVVQAGEGAAAAGWHANSNAARAMQARATNGDVERRRMGSSFETRGGYQLASISRNRHAAKVP
jgi:hypothetical protein